MKPYKEHVQRTMIMWLEWKAKQPGNPERTREILKGVRW